MHALSLKFVFMRTAAQRGPLPNLLRLKIVLWWWMRYGGMLVRCSSGACRAHWGEFAQCVAVDGNQMPCSDSAVASFGQCRCLVRTPTCLVRTVPLPCSDSAVALFGLQGFIRTLRGSIRTLRVVDRHCWILLRCFWKLRWLLS